MTRLREVGVSILCTLLRIPGAERLYTRYLDARYGCYDPEDTYAENPLGGSWR